MSLPEDRPPPTANQNIHDETPKSKPFTTTTNSSINTNANIVLFKTLTAQSTTKIKSRTNF